MKQSIRNRALETEHWKQSKKKHSIGNREHKKQSIGNIEHKKQSIGNREHKKQSIGNREHKKQSIGNRALETERKNHCVENRTLGTENT